MTIEVNPVGLTCNLKCTYCYQESMRPETAGYIKIRKVLKQIKKQGQEFTIFGGEPLLTPVKTLEILFAYGFKHYGKNGIQTNGTLITQRHIDLFKKYNVYVGVSTDGPDELSCERSSRVAKQLTMVTTRMTNHNILELLKNGVGTSIILTLHRSNAVPPHLDTLYLWLKDLATRGMRSARIHLMELDNPAESRKLVLTPEENAAAVLRLSEIKDIDFDLLGEMRRNLLNDFSNSSCIWNGCDPYTTPAVVGIDADGSLSNCGRANKTGVNYRKATTPGRERLVALYNTPYENGGCQGCRFFVACKGQCPGTGLDGDWRNRTEHCETLLILFGSLERELVAEGKEPISLRSDRKELEDNLVTGVSDSHGDCHEDWHGDSPHGDSWFVPVGRPE